MVFRDDGVSRENSSTNRTARSPISEVCSIKPMPLLLISS